MERQIKIKKMSFKIKLKRFTQSECLFDISITLITVAFLLFLIYNATDVY